MVIGGGVRGGRVYGTWPGLSVDKRYDGRDLPVTTDFRVRLRRDRHPALGLGTRASLPGYASSGRSSGLFALESDQSQ
jgi:uncharacterized protein (DUF1501 family)